MSVDSAPPATKVGVITWVPVLPGKREEVARAFSEYAQAAVEEAIGVAEIFTVSVDAENPKALWLYQVYSDVSVYEDHFHTAARRALHEKLDVLRAGPARLIKIEPFATVVGGGLYEPELVGSLGWNTVSRETT